MTELEIGSTEEALDILIRGLDNRGLACATLNAETSQSHSVINIRFVQASKDNQVKVLKNIQKKFQSIIFI